jgi:hypothetical protein
VGLYSDKRIVNQKYHCMENTFNRHTLPNIIG